MKITRTIATSKFTVTALLNDGSLYTDDVAIVGETNVKAIERKLMKDLDAKAVTLVPLSFEENKFEMDIETFVNHATKIEKKDEE